VLNSILHPLLGLGGWQAYALVAALCFGEAALLLGFVLPGETAVVFGGVLASEHHVALGPLVVLVVCCAIVGDSVGYEVGRHLGPFLLRHRPLRGHPAVERTRLFVKQRGSIAVFLGRFTAVFRALVPGVAGMSGVSYPRFLLANALGGLIWGVGYTLAGYYVGAQVLHTGSWISTGIIVAAAAGLVLLEVRRRVGARKARRKLEESVKPAPQDEEKAADADESRPKESTIS
jgi:membrane-associated protein